MAPVHIFRYASGMVCGIWPRRRGVMDPSRPVQHPPRLPQQLLAVTLSLALVATPIQAGDILNIIWASVTADECHHLNDGPLVFADADDGLDHV